MDALKIAGLGLAAGFIHVITGPDHIASIAALSVGGKWKAIKLGVKWGVGHSFGLLIIAIIFFSLKGQLDFTSIEYVGSWVVVVCLSAIGVLGIAQAVKLRRAAKLNKLASEQSGSYLEHESTNDQRLLLSESCSSSMSNENTQGGSDVEKDGSSVSGVLKEPIVEEEPCNHSCFEAWKIKYCNLKNPRTQTVLAFVMGTAMGIAGPGGVLGVLPAVAQPSWELFSLYLGMFFVSSIFCMALFAMLYGEATSRMESLGRDLPWMLTAASSVLALFVALAFVVLILTDNVEAVLGE
eukprot:GFYU01005587.1.p1 GENE.GFYU01005587.1~~GFYU01005587.1.p1  ORF type:complete len:295 (+),score=36.48 GFYU01005587.1:262-1146(+)